jgi:hypothetical protein
LLARLACSDGRAVRRQARQGKAVGRWGVRDERDQWARAPSGSRDVSGDLVGQRASSALSRPSLTWGLKDEGSSACGSDLAGKAEHLPAPWRPWPLGRRSGGRVSPLRSATQPSPAGRRSLTRTVQSSAKICQDMLLCSRQLLNVSHLAFLCMTSRRL